MGVLKNSGLLPVILKKENEFGVPALDFTDNVGHAGTGLTTAKGIPIKQAFDSPFNVVDDYQKEVIETTDGQQISKEDNVLLGDRLVNCSFGNQIDMNGFVAIASMFAQNDYDYVDIITDGSIISSTIDSNVVSVTIGDAGALSVKTEVVISDRTAGDENGTYTIKAITGNVIDFVYSGWDTTDTEGSVKSTLGSHRMKIENVNDCTKQELENSYSMYFPQKFPDKDSDCTTSQGEVYAGIVPKSLDIDFKVGSYSVDTIGASLEDYGVKSPRQKTDYFKPSIGSYQRKNFGTLQKYNSDTASWVDLKTLALTLNIAFNVTEDDKVYNAGQLDMAIVDGVVISGTYETIFVNADVDDNISKSIYEQRGDIQNGGTYRLCTKNTTGEGIYVTTNLKFLKETYVKEAGGHKLTTEFRALTSDTQNNVEFEIINRYDEDLSSYL